MEKVKQVILCGLGGQGIVLAGVILGHAAFKDMKWVSSMSSYGAAARGGICRAEVVISERPVIFPRVIEANILIAMYRTAYNKCIREVKQEGGTVIYDPRFISPEEVEGVKYVSVPATSTAVEELHNKLVASIIMLSAAVEITGLVSKDALRAAVEENVQQALRELNLEAVEIGFKLGKAYCDEAQQVIG